MSNSVRPQRRQLTRLPRPWDSPGKNTGVGSHFLLKYMKGRSESEVAQLCGTLCDPMDCSLPGSSIQGIFQARVLEWGASAFSTFIHCSDSICSLTYFFLQTKVRAHDCCFLGGLVRSCLVTLFKFYVKLKWIKNWLKKYVHAFQGYVFPKHNL